MSYCKAIRDVLDPHCTLLRLLEHMEELKKKGFLTHNKKK